MDSTTIEAMHEQVRVIYKAATGAMLGEDAAPVLQESLLAADEIVRRFAELDALARTLPALTQRIPPFSFTPLVDVLEGPTDLLIEIAVPGVVGDDVSVQVLDDQLVVTGVRRGACGSNGRSFVSAQIPRGPFKVALPLPWPVSLPAQTRIEHGIVAIQLQKSLTS